MRSVAVECLVVIHVIWGNLNSNLGFFNPDISDVPQCHLHVDIGPAFRSYSQTVFLTFRRLMSTIVVVPHR